MVMTFTCNCRLHRRAGWFALRPAISLIVVKVLLIKSPKQRLETYCFCSVSYYYLLLLLFLFLLLLFFSVLSFFPWTMNLSTADLRNYWTEFHETWWSYRYMILVGPKVFKIFEMSAIFKMAAKSRKWAVKIQHCPISSKLYLWVDNDVPN